MTKIIKAILLLFSFYELAYSSFSTEEEIKKIKNNETDPRDYGYSFAGINSLQAQMYEAIFKQSTETQSRTPVMDIGSGHNHNAWKILTAGG